MKITEIQVSYSSPSRQKHIISKSIECYKVLLASWNLKTIELQEEFKVIYLNRNNEVLGIYHLSKGGNSGTVVDPKLTFSVALKCNASSVVLAHNHPSGNLSPSRADIQITKKMVKGGKLLDIVVLDHIILSKDSYYSFADNGLV